jgi:hypothetical protein
VLAGREIAFLNGALLRVASLALEKKFHALAPALPAIGASISGHSFDFSLPNQNSRFPGGPVQFTAMARLRPA